VQLVELPLEKLKKLSVGQSDELVIDLLERALVEEQRVLIELGQILAVVIELFSVVVKVVFSVVISVVFKVSHR
jgi:hypothetical protein